MASTCPSSWRRLPAIAALGGGLALGACDGESPSGPTQGGDGVGPIPRPLLVVASRSGEISYRDPVSGESLTTASVLPPLGDLAVSPDASAAYATGDASEETGAARSLWLLDLETGEVSGEHGAGRAGALAPTEGAKVWMTLAADAIAEVDAGTGERRLLPLESSKTDLAYAAGTGRLYAAGRTTVVVDAAAATVLGEIEVGQGVGEAALAPDESVLYLSHPSNELTEIDLGEGAVARRLSYDEAPGMVIVRSAELAVRPGSTEVLLTSTLKPELVAVDGETMEVARRLELDGEPTDVLVTPDGSTAYVALADRGEVLVVDLTAWEPVDRLAVGSEPLVLAWVPTP